MAQTGLVSAGPKGSSNPYINNNPLRHVKGHERSAKLLTRAKLMAVTHFLPTRDKSVKPKAMTNASPAKTARRPAADSHDHGPVGSGSSRSVSQMSRKDSKRVFNSKVSPEHVDMKTNNTPATQNGHVTYGLTTPNQEVDVSTNSVQRNGVMKKAKLHGDKAKSSVEGNRNDVPAKTPGNKQGIERNKSQENGVISVFDEVECETNTQPVKGSESPRKVIKRQPVNTKVSNQQGPKNNKQSNKLVGKPKEQEGNKRKGPLPTKGSGLSQNAQKNSVSTIIVASNCFQKSLADRIKERHQEIGFTIDPPSDAGNSTGTGSQVTLGSADRQEGKLSPPKVSSDSESNKSCDTLAPTPRVARHSNPSLTSIGSPNGSLLTLMKKHAPDLTPVDGENASPIIRRRQWRKAIDN